MQVKILRPKFLSFPWSKWKNLSDHQVEKFLNNYMRITDELVFTQIYSILHLISIQKWKKRLNSERKYRTCDYSLFGAYYSNIRILFIISKRTEYEYEYHYSVFYYSNIRITNYSLQHWWRRILARCAPHQNILRPHHLLIGDIETTCERTPGDEADVRDHKAHCTMNIQATWNCL